MTKNKQPLFQELHTYRIRGQVALRQPGENEKIQDHEEIIKALSPDEAVELSLTGFTEEQEPVWEKGFKVEHIFRFTFEAYEILSGHPCPLAIEPFVGTHEESEAYIAEKTKGCVLYDGVVYQQFEP